MARVVKFTGIIKVDNTVSDEDIHVYIKDALKFWGTNLYPGGDATNTPADPLFGQQVITNITVGGRSYGGI